MVAGTGTNNIDIAAARELGIAVCNVRGYCTASVVQHVWALILSLTQHVSGYSQLVRSGSWSQNEVLMVLAHPIRELSGRTFGVVGWGELGRGAARIAEAFGMRVVIAERRGASPQPDRLGLDSCWPCRTSSPCIARLNDFHPRPDRRPRIRADETRCAADQHRAGRIGGRPCAAAALKAGRLGGAGIDVLPQEPPLDDEPLLDPGIPNLILTPHVAWAAHEARQRCLDEMAANIREFAGGRRRSRVD